MEIQSDRKMRVVAIANLEAMCERISGNCHRFEVSRVTNNRVYVQYSNPNEYGSEHPMVAQYPAYKYGNTMMVVLSILTVRHDNWHGEGWQAFEPLMDCPTLFRAGGVWQNEYEALLELHPEIKITSAWDKDGCIQTWYTAKSTAFQSYLSAQECAVAEFRATKI